MFLKNIKGQIFPFMLAVIAIFLIIAMMVVNLGKVAVFRTDASNAADAGSLAGVSSLSQGLLGIGLRNDKFAAQTAINTAYMTYYIVNYDGPFDLINFVYTYISQVYQGIYEFKRLRNQEGVTSWAAAKRAALQFAFQNSGVDQPPDVNYREYKVELKQSGDYAQYRKDLLTNTSMQSGFSRFMNDPVGGFGAPVGAIEPSLEMSVPPYEVESTWNWVGRKLDQTNPNYSGNANYFKVNVRGNQYYSIWMLRFDTYFGSDLTNYVINLAVNALKRKYANPLSMCGYGPWWKGVCIETVNELIPLMPASFSLDDKSTGDDEEKKQTNENYITVKTQRYRENDLGMWKFDYSDIISRSQARTYKENESLDTGNTADSIFIKEKLRELVTGDSINATNLTMKEDWFDDQDRHLFETEMTDVR